jgi:hypothetical protein
MPDFIGADKIGADKIGADKSEQTPTKNRTLAIANSPAILQILDDFKPSLEQ